MSNEPFLYLIYQTINSGRLFYMCLVLVYLIGVMAFYERGNGKIASAMFGALLPVLLVVWLVASAMDLFKNLGGKQNERT